MRTTDRKVEVFQGSNKMDDSQLRNLAAKILSSYHEVYSDLAHAFPLRFYENAMVRCLRAQGVYCRQRPKFEIRFKDHHVGTEELPILVVQDIIVKSQVSPRLKRVHMAQTNSYMRVANCQIGILLNFGGSKPDFKRFAPDSVYDSGELTQRTGAEMARNTPYPQLTAAILDATIEAHDSLGPGFSQSVYGNACYYELWQRRISAEPRRQLQIFFKDDAIGQLTLDHFIVNSKVMLFPVAVKEVTSVNVDGLKSWMARNNIQLGVLVNFLDIRIRPVFVTLDSPPLSDDGTVIRPYEGVQY